MNFKLFPGSGAKFTTEMLEKVRQLLSVYEGTHNYHNFTTGKDAEDADANRYIKSITVKENCTRLIAIFRLVIHLYWMM